MPDVKRLNYFNHQFLEESDFRDEQAYHLEASRRHNRLLHSWGIAEGLEVEAQGHHQVRINPGVAIDNLGRELVLGEAVAHEVSKHGANSQVNITLAYRELTSEEDRQTAHGAEGYNRITERPEVNAQVHHVPPDGSVIALARVHLDGNGNIRQIDQSVREYATTAIAPGAVTAEELANNAVTSPKLADRAVTEEKLSDELRGRFGGARGWVRLPFRPSVFERVIIDPDSDHVAEVKVDQENGFIVGLSDARCAREARGAMGIPIPAGASQVKALRITGSTYGSVEVYLYRTGWNPAHNRGERTELLKHLIQPSGLQRFDHVFPVNAHQHLRDEHALVVAAIAKGETRIWLVAAQFE